MLTFSVFTNIFKNTISSDLKQTGFQKEADNLFSKTSTIPMMARPQGNHKRKVEEIKEVRTVKKTRNASELFQTSGVNKSSSISLHPCNEGASPDFCEI